jgi:hypothetical protein
LERKKRLKSSTLGDNFNPDKHVNDFIQGIKNNLENKQKKSPRNPKSPDSPNNPDDSKYNPVNPLDPFQSTSTASPN